MAIRNAVKYVRSSGPRLQSFQLRVLTGKVSRGSLSLDCTTRWNSTYLMLCAALKFRVAFEKLLAEDMLYNDYFNEEEETGQKRVGPVLFWLLFSVFGLKLSCFPFSIFGKTTT